MPIRPPKFLNVAGHKVSVSLVPRKDVGGDGCLLYRVNSILVDEDLCSSQQASTVLHEILHAAFYVSGMDHEVKPAIEEKIVRGLEPILFHVLRNNPKLVKYLQCA